MIYINIVNSHSVITESKTILTLLRIRLPESFLLSVAIDQGNVYFPTIWFPETVPLREVGGSALRTLGG